jgi:hypothetical protein
LIARRAVHHCAPLNLIVGPDEAAPEVIELLERHQKMVRAVGEAVELPDKHAVDLAIPGDRLARSIADLH